MKQFVRFYITCVLVMLANSAGAQQYQEVQKDDNGTIRFARLVQGSVYRLDDGISFLKAALQGGIDDSWRPVSRTADQLGMEHIRYQQFFKGVKVENAEYLLHGRNGIIESMNGDYQQVILNSVIPALSVDAGLKAVTGYMKADKYMWQDPQMEQQLKQRTRNANATYYPGGELVITRDFKKGGKNKVLAWKYQVYAEVPADAQEVYADAVTGEIVRASSLICKTNISCTAQTIFSGTVNITGDSFTGGTRLQEDRSGVTISTQNLNHYDWWQTSNATDFVNSSTSFTPAGWSSYSTDRSALDAHWAFEKVFDYWQSVHSRYSINNAGIPITGYTHMNSPSLGADNAAWVLGAHYMVFGDGTDPNKPFVCLDVAGHELGHGITEFTANFAYVVGQESSALHEGFSDIWGACVENWAAPGVSTKNPWLLGQEVMAAPYSCIRNMQNPKDNSAYNLGPDTYGGAFWDAANPPHMNALVLDRWFYLLSQGGSGTNDLGNSYNVPAITINKAQLIAYRAEALYLNSSANYLDTRNATLQAARDLYGASSCEAVAVIKAWYAVGVGGDYSPVSSVYITGSGVVCGNSQTYTLNSVSGTLSPDAITWEVRAPVIGSGYTLPLQNVCTLTASGNQATLTKVANGNVWLVAKVANCPVAVSTYKEVTFGVSPISNNGAYAPNNPNQWYTTITSTVHFTPGTTTAISMANPGNNTYTFTKSAGSSSNSSLIYWANGNVGAVFSRPVNNNSHINLSVQTSNACGTSGSTLVLYYNGPPIFRAVVAPNPVSDILTLQYDDQSFSDMQKQNERITSIQIIDKSGVVVLTREGMAVSKIIRVDISQLKPDVYTVVVNYKKGGEQHKISVIR